MDKLNSGISLRKFYFTSLIITPVIYILFLFLVGLVIPGYMGMSFSFYALLGFGFLLLIYTLMVSVFFPYDLRNSDESKRLLFRKLISILLTILINVLLMISNFLIIIYTSSFFKAYYFIGMLLMPFMLIPSSILSARILKMEQKAHMVVITRKSAWYLFIALMLLLFIPFSYTIFKFVGSTPGGGSGIGLFEILVTLPHLLLLIFVLAFLFSIKKTIVKDNALQTNISNSGSSLPLASD